MKGRHPVSSSEPTQTPIVVHARETAGAERRGGIAVPVRGAGFSVRARARGRMFPPATAFPPGRLGWLWSSHRKPVKRPRQAIHIPTAATTSYPVRIPAALMSPLPLSSPPLGLLAVGRVGRIRRRGRMRVGRWHVPQAPVIFTPRIPMRGY